MNQRSNFLVEDELDFNTTKRIKSEHQLLALVFELADADVVSESEPNVA